MPKYDALDFHSNTNELDPCLAATVRFKTGFSWKWIGVILTLVLLLIAGIAVACILLIPSGQFTVDSLDKSSEQLQDTKDYLPGTNHTAQEFEVVDKPFEQSSVKPNIASIQKPVIFVPTREYFETCDEYLKNGYNSSGVYRLQRPGHYDFSAQCMMNEDNDGKAWMIMQKRTGKSVTFWNRTLEEYAQGFGDQFKDSWLGLRNVRHLIESGHKLQLRMEIDGERCQEGKGKYYVGIWNFEIGSEDKGFPLKVPRILDGNFTTPITNIELGNGLKFKAMQQGSKEDIPCFSRLRTGGWWSADEACPIFSLNGEYSCRLLETVYGLAVQQWKEGQFTNTKFNIYLHPSSTRMSLRVCDESKEKCS